MLWSWTLKKYFHALFFFIARTIDKIAKRTFLSNVRPFFLPLIILTINSRYYPKRTSNPQRADDNDYVNFFLTHLNNPLFKRPEVSRETKSSNLGFLICWLLDQSETFSADWRQGLEKFLVFVLIV